MLTAIIAIANIYGKSSQLPSINGRNSCIEDVLKA